MAKENSKNVSTEILLKRKKFFTFIFGVYLGLISVFVALIIYSIIQDKLDTTLILSGAAISSMVWLPLYILSKINKELATRNNK